MTSSRLCFGDLGSQNVNLRQLFSFLLWLTLSGVGWLLCCLPPHLIGIQECFHDPNEPLPVAFKFMNHFVANDLL